MPATPTFLSPSDMRVHRYRQIMLWPVLLESSHTSQDDEHTTPTSQWREWIETLEQDGWQQKVNSLPQAHTPPGITDFSGCEPTYEEVVYFHPFARDLLYGDGSLHRDERAMLRFRRSDVTGMQVTISAADLPHRPSQDSGAVDFGFTVPRVELYLCKPLVAILAVEVVWQESASVDQLCLADVLVLQSRIREVYPPFFQGDRQAEPGNCPRRVAWLGPSKSGSIEVKAVSDFDKGREHFAKQVQQGAEPPVAEHWAFFLKPIAPFLKRDGHGPRFRQIIDDRLPGLTYVAVDDPRLISAGDFDRLAFCETGGDTPFPYSADFLAAERSHHVYDRYWRETADHDSPNATGTRFNTRYLCSGFQFVAVGSWNNWFFANLVQDHVRRHYFRLALIVHFQRAALLKFADDMSEAIKRIKGRSPRQELSDERFRNHIEQLQMTFLKFVSRVWFSEVSNQLQGQELFRWWSELLGNQRLFDEVQQMNQAMHSMLTNHDSRELARRTFGVTVAAAVIAVVAVAISLLKR